MSILDKIETSVLEKARNGDMNAIEGIHYHAMNSEDPKFMASVLDKSLLTVNQALKLADKHKEVSKEGETHYSLHANGLSKVTLDKDMDRDIMIFHVWLLIHANFNECDLDVIYGGDIELDIFDPLETDQDIIDNITGQVQESDELWAMLPN